ncbi:hypothetical protein [Providencia rettgeri]|uniref:hypothetical protein n=1 Tax=Providencia rettgeri TaxID=587 RepID=UPI002362845B|nr:hypothetical protein [Providencia rettgeri]
MRIFFTILFTAIFCFLVLLPVFYSIKNRWSENKKNEKIKTESLIEKRSLFLLDERSLQSQPMFWTVIALPLVVGAILWASVAYQYEWELSTFAYSSLMKNAQFPFLILALSPVLGAFVMYGHRSLQTFTQINATNKQIDTASKQLETAKKQFEEVRKKNKVDLYHSNKRFLKEEISSLRTRSDESIIQYNQLYYNIFFINENYTDTLIEPFFTELNKHINDFNDALNILLHQEIDEFYDLFSNEREDKTSKSKSENVYELSEVEELSILAVFVKIIHSKINNVSDGNNNLKKYLFMDIKFDIFNFYLEMKESRDSEFIQQKKKGNNVSKSNKLRRLGENQEAREAREVREAREYEKQYYYDTFFSELLDEVKSTFAFIKMIALITLDDKSIYKTLPALERGYSIISAFEKKNGDKLATENQNPPE